MGAALGRRDLSHGRAHKTNASNISLEMAAQGLGVTVALTSLCSVYIARGLLVEPFKVRPLSRWTYYISRRKLMPGASVDRLMEHIAAYNEATAVSA